MFERYTDEAKQTIIRAKHEADAVGSREIGSVHILLALLNDVEVAGQVLSEIPLQQLREQILARLTRQSRRLGPGDRPLSREARQMLTSIAEEASKSGRQFVGSADILLGLLRTETGSVAEILGQNRISADSLRPQIEALILKENAEEERRLAQIPRNEGANEPTLISMVVDMAKREGDRQALKLIDDFLADPNKDRAATLRELWFTATVLAFPDLQLIKHYCEELLACDSEDPMALYVLADCLQQQGHLEEAKRYATKSFANLSRSSSKALPDLLTSRWPELREIK